MISVVLFIVLTSQYPDEFGWVYNSYAVGMVFQQPVVSRQQIVTVGNNGTGGVQRVHGFYTGLLYAGSNDPCLFSIC